MQGANSKVPLQHCCEKVEERGTASQDTCLFWAMRSFHSKHPRRVTVSSFTVFEPARKSRFFYVFYAFLWTSEAINHAGGVNVFEDLEKTWNTVSWEAVVEADPDIIVINDYGDTTAEEKIQSLKDNEALSDVTAIKNENFLVITLPEVFASTRVADTIEKFAEAFHPECFE